MCLICMKSLQHNLDLMKCFLILTQCGIKFTASPSKSCQIQKPYGSHERASSGHNVDSKVEPLRIIAKSESFLSRKSSPKRQVSLYPAVSARFFAQSLNVVFHFFKEDVDLRNTNRSPERLTTVKPEVKRNNYGKVLMMLEMKCLSTRKEGQLTLLNACACDKPDN